MVLPLLPPLVLLEKDWHSPQVPVHDLSHLLVHPPKRVLLTEMGTLYCTSTPNLLLLRDCGPMKTGLGCLVLLEAFEAKSASVAYPKPFLCHL